MDKSYGTLQAKEVGAAIYLCDTNFILRYIVGDNLEMLTETQLIFNQIKNGEIEAVIEPEVFAEIIFVLSSFYEFSRARVVKDLGALLSYRGFVKNYELYTNSLKLFDSNSKLSIVDCLLAARARNARIHLLSFDKALTKQVQENKV